MHKHADLNTLFTGEVTNDDTKGYAVEVNVITTDTGADTKIFYTRYGEVESGMSDVTLVPELAANNTHIDLYGNM